MLRSFFAAAFLLVGPALTMANADEQNSEITPEDIEAIRDHIATHPEEWAKTFEDIGKWVEGCAEQQSGREAAPRDKAELWECVYESGGVSAQHVGCLIFSEGAELVPQDHIKAANLCRKAAEQGYAPAQSSLGVLYFRGEGVPQDYVQAHMWFNLAASRLPSGEKRDSAVKNRAITASVMTPEQIAEAQRLAREWRQNVDQGW